MILGNLKKIFAMARAYHIPIVSAMDTHRENEGFRNSPPHCVEGTPGHDKVKFSLLRHRTLVEANNNLDLPYNIWSQYRQVILRRRTRDFLGNPKADRLLTELQPKLFIVFGVGLERSIRRLILGLIGRGRRVAFIPEACGYWNETDADLTVRLIVAKNGVRLDLERLDGLFKKATEKRIERVFSKALARRPPSPPRSLAG
jgi:nicotinamidase-related amidase